MNDCGADKQRKQDTNWQKDDKCNRADARADQRRKRVMAIRENPDGSQTKRKKKRDDSSNAPADQGIHDWFAQAAFHFHCPESDIRLGQNHLQRFDESTEESALLTVFPRQAGTCRQTLSCRSCGDRRHRRRHRLRRRAARSCRNVGSKFGKLRERLPTGHSFPPTEIARNETSGAKSFANLFFRKCAQTRCAPINVDHRHNVRVLVSRSGKVNLRCSYGAVRRHDRPQAGGYSYESKRVTTAGLSSARQKYQAATER